MNEKLKNIFVEIPTIVLSVIIALGFNEWNNQRERKNLVESVMSTIKEEVIFNRENVEKAYYYHVPLLKELQNGTHQFAAIPIKKFGLKNLSEQLLQNLMTEFLEEMGEVIEQPPVVQQKEDSLFSMIYKKNRMTLRVSKDTLFIFGRGNIVLRSALIRNNAWKIAQAAQIAHFLPLDLIAAMSELDELHVQFNSTSSSIVEILYKGESDVTPALEDLIATEKKLLEKYGDLEVKMMKKN